MNARYHRKRDDISIMGIVYLIVLGITLIIEKAVALEERFSNKYPKTAAFLWFLIIFVSMGLLGKSDMDAEIARYGN